ncbi:hypothetical protein DRQ32_08155 [bacterium]|nr:MAG: hypothetical protein DRQ32_08155 [bacterium]
MQAEILVITCGAIARELVRIRTLNNWDHIEFQCLPAGLHNTPEDIPAAVKAKIESQASGYQKVFVAYADCGTAGKLDKVLDEYGIERIPGAHCYQFFTGNEKFNDIADSEPGTFYLTDFLARHFERLVIKGLKLDQRPQLIPYIFGNYKRVLYLAQTDSEELQAMARSHANFLGLEYDYCYTSDQPLSLVLEPALGPTTHHQKALPL